MSLFDNIIHRSRFSKFVAVVSEDDELIDEGSVDTASTSKRPSSLNPVCGVKKPNFVTGTKKPNLVVNLIDGLLQHGRLTFEQLFVREASKQGNAIARDELRVQFNRLVRAQYVERCPRPEPFLSDADDKPASSRRRGAKTFEETPTIEQQALTASALSVAVRFSPLTDIGADTRADVKIKRPNVDLLVGDKRKYENLEMDQETQSTTTDNEVLWRANYEKFIHCLMLKVCATIFRRKLSRDASIVVDALMESSKQDKSHDRNTVKASLESILSRARMKAGDSVTREYLTANLEKLECRFSQQESGVICIIENLKEIIEGSQKEEVEAVVLKRYGENACRIFRLLTKEVNGQTQPYETDNISDIAFVDKIEVKGVLYKLWKNEFLDMEKGVSYASGQMQQFLWRVNKRTLWELIQNELYHGALNISLRIAHTVKQQHEDVVTGKEKEQLLRSRWILESSLLKIDDTLLVFRNF